MNTSRPPLFVIAGPTASGKSALALALAERVEGVIVNADASQLYRDIPILSAAPSADERARADHRLYGVLDGANPGSAADYASMAAREIHTAHAAGATPILVGGTGLYLRALLEGIAPVPAIDPAVRAEIRASPSVENYKELERLDPEAAKRLSPNDTTRVARALEVIRSTGRPLAHWQSSRVGGIANSMTVRGIVLLPPRDWLYARCDARFSAMLKAGAINEVASLRARDLNPSLPVHRAIGVAEIGALLDGEIDEDEALAAARQATRRYAKRQYTWFRRQTPSDWTRFEEPLDAPGALDRALALLSGTS